MSVPGASNPLLLSSAAGGAAVADIERSVRFYSADSAYLNSTASAGSNTTWTLSTWVKKTGNDNHIFGAGTGNVPGRFGFGFDGSDKIFVFVVDNSSTVYLQNSDAVFRDPTAWYHIVVVADTTNATPADRLIVYVNGVRQSLSGGAMPLNQNTFVNTVAPQTIGRRSYTASDYFNGYLADFQLIDGTACDIADLGQYDETTNVWTPLVYSGSHGTNGFRLLFNNTANLGEDSVGSNDFTVNNIAPGGGTLLYSASSNWSTGNATVLNPGSAFDGSIETEATCNYTAVPANDWLQWTYSFTASTSLRFYIKGNPITQSISINGLSGVSPSGNGRWLSLSEVYPGGSPTFPFSFTSIRITPDSSSRNGRLSAVEVDGVVLVDPFESDSLLDSPTNGTQTDTGVGGEVSGNYCTWNSAAKGADATLTNGNLDVAYGTSGTRNSQQGTFGMSSGKWYWEVTITDSNSALAQSLIGIADSPDPATVGQYPGSNSRGWGYYGGSGDVYHSGIATSYGDTYDVNDVIGVAFDADNGNLYYYKNGTVQNSGTAAFTGLTTGPYFPSIADAGAAAAFGAATNFGQRQWTHSAPSGYKALCTANLTAPTIDKPSAYMDVPLYTGIASTQVISGLAFSPDLVWTKSRANAYSHLLYDSVRQATKYLSSNSDSAEGTGASTLTSFNTDGFTLGSGDNSNVSGNSVAWTWNAGDGSPVSNTDGTITSSVKASPTAGFSIVSWTGTLTASTVGHGLGVTPEMIIVKNRDEVYNWGVYTKTTGNANTLFLDLDNASTPASLFWNSTSPTPSVFSVGAHQATNNNNKQIIAYCFTPIESYSAFGSYTGNASTDGPFVYTSMRPKFVILKRTDSTANWFLFDSERPGYNVIGGELYPSLSNQEAIADRIDFCSNGFKLRTTTNAINALSGTFVYMAFAESPFKYARAR